MDSGHFFSAKTGETSRNERCFCSYSASVLQVTYSDFFQRLDKYVKLTAIDVLVMAAEPVNIMPILARVLLLPIFSVESIIDKPSQS